MRDGFRSGLLFFGRKSSLRRPAMKIKCEMCGKEMGYGNGETRRMCLRCIEEEPVRREMLAHVVSCVAPTKGLPCSLTFFAFNGLIPRCEEGKAIYEKWGEKRVALGRVA